jgi:hypothetical protein
VRGFYSAFSIGVAFLVGACRRQRHCSPTPIPMLNRTDDAADRAAQDFAMAAFAANGSALDVLHAAVRYDTFELLTLSERLLLNVSAG